MKQTAQDLKTEIKAIRKTNGGNSVYEKSG